LISTEALTPLRNKLIHGFGKKRMETGSRSLSTAVLTSEILIQEISIFLDVGNGNGAPLPLPSFEISDREQYTISQF
jgi:hypothetical protein